MKYKSIAILTGAGISAESGIKTFRDSNGLWENHNIDDVSSPEGLKRNPELVHKFYNDRRRELKTVNPNAAHYALVDLTENFEGKVTIITQNVDDLHERAAKEMNVNINLIHMHGELNKVRCTECNHAFDWIDDILEDTKCMVCGKLHSVRPFVVFFNENIHYQNTISNVLSEADLFISIGTSGNVYPAAVFAREVNGDRVELNLERTLNGYFTEGHYGKATEIVPAFVQKILQN